MLAIVASASPGAWAAKKKAARAIELSAVGQRLEAGYAEQLRTLQAEISHAVPAVASADAKGKKGSAAAATAAGAQGADAEAAPGQTGDLQAPDDADPGAVKGKGSKGKTGGKKAATKGKSGAKKKKKMKK